MADTENPSSVPTKRMKIMTDHDPDGDVVMSSAVIEKDGVEKTNLVYLYFIDDKGSGDWYVLDTEAETLHKDPEMSNHDLPSHFGCTVFNSQVYVVGGQAAGKGIGSRASYLPPTNKVQIFDTKNSKWELGPSMNGGRAFPIVVSLKGKLYVFGCNGLRAWGSDNRCGKPWAECYDPTLRAWAPLPDPPPEVMGGRFHGASAVHGGVGDSIIIYNEAIFCLYDTSQQNWHFIQATSFKDIPGANPDDIPPDIAGHAFIRRYTAMAVVVHATLYWCFKDLFAFDLTRNEGFVKPVYRFSSEKPLCRFGSEKRAAAPLLQSCALNLKTPLLAANGKEQLCLIWPDRRNVYCKKFQIKRSCDTTERIILDEIPGKESYLIPRGYRLYNYAVVQEHNDDMGNHDLDRDDEKPQVSNPRDILEKLSRTMYVKNFNRFSRNYGCAPIIVESTDGELGLVVNPPDSPELPQKDEIQLDKFLQDLGLESYVTKFQEQEITLPILRTLTIEDFEALEMPVGPRRMLRCALVHL